MDEPVADGARIEGAQVEEPARTPRERRRRQTTAEILDAAWTLARRDGLAAISMRELGAMVGLRAQSLYGYFASKGALYDAMFREGNEDARRLQSGWLDEVTATDDPRAVVRRFTVEFVRWCNEDPVRYQLLFQRTIPDWEPSEDVYRLAVEHLDRLRTSLEHLGIRGDEALDIFTALISGLTAQQVSNDPGGDRWVRLTDRALDMFFDHFGPDADPTRGDHP